MVDNQHRQIPGYRDLDQDTVDLIAAIKHREQELTEFFRSVKERCANTQQAQRDLSIAVHSFEDGFIRLVRAVAEPDSPWTGV